MVTILVRLSVYLSVSISKLIRGQLCWGAFRFCWFPPFCLFVCLSLSFFPHFQFPISPIIPSVSNVILKKARDKLNKNKSCSHKQTGVNVRKDLGWWALLLLLLVEADYSTSDVFWPSQAEFSTQPPVMGLKCWACVPVTSLALDANEVRWPKTTGLQSYPSCFSLFSLITFWQEKGVIRLCFLKVLLFF